MGLDEILDLTQAEKEDWYEMRQPLIWKEVTVLHSELRRAANFLEDKVYRMKYYGETPTLEQLTELSLDLNRILRTAQEK